MVSVTSASHYITAESCYSPRYQSKSSMYMRDLIPRNSSELAEAVPIDVYSVPNANGLADLTCCFDFQNRYCLG